MVVSVNGPTFGGVEQELQGTHKYKEASEELREGIGKLPEKDAEDKEKPK